MIKNMKAITILIVNGRLKAKTSKLPPLCTEERKSDWYVQVPCSSNCV